MKNSIKVVCGTIAGFVLGSITIVGANQAIQAIQNTNIKVSLDGVIQEFKDETTGETQYPITYNDRTYLPLRNVANLAGLSVDYDNNTNTAKLEQSVIKEIISTAENDLKGYVLYDSNGEVKNKVVKVMVNCIDAYDEDFINMICSGANLDDNFDGHFIDFCKYQVALTANTTNDIPTFGTMRFTIEYESDVKAGENYWAGNGPDYVYGKYATGTREFVYEDGKLIFNTGGTFVTDWDEINRREEAMKNQDDSNNIFPNQTFDLKHLVYTIDDETEPLDQYYTEEGYGDFIWSGLLSNYSASSTLKENGVEYVASNLNSFSDINNCWSEGANGSGIGETITVTSFGSCDKVEWRGKDYTNHDDVIEYLLNEYNSDPGRIDKTQITKDNINNYHNVVKRIAIINGYAKNDETWKNNNRVKKLKLTINGEKEYILNLNDTKDMQVFEIDYKCEITKKITCVFEILEVYKGTKYDDTCITAIDVDGDADVIWGGR